ncbi:hypothetical protein [Paracoccus saliphilus]|uniref:Uncharacterized protein n=1 Tax=Paracoccus saliphilus TaxID=405559 RepID=A0AA46A4X8_9RHOB|nr:hypothetical protein [Paracoccus saliphilus]WCR05058.1 hypothetical protein JHX88_10335 [Paracoccus saliphilus]SIS70673.1 hypothetical protein SAMN05421772_103136 [Paracoccus saliphilus]
MSSAKISWKDVKPVLSGFSSIQLLGLVQDLYRLNAENASFIHARLLSEDTTQCHLTPYMTRIQHAISPKKPWKQDVKLAEGRKAISEFKKANGNIRDTLTLMIYYVKCGNDFTLEFGDIDEGFYDSLCSMFSSVVQTLLKQQDQGLFEEFMPSLETELDRVDGRIGWGYPDELADHLADLKDAFE